MPENMSADVRGAAWRTAIREADVVIDNTDFKLQNKFTPSTDHV